MYGKTLSIPDAAMEPWYALLFGETVPDSGPREAKRALARRVVERFHGPDAARDAEAGFDRIFVEHAAPDDMDEFVLAPDTGTEAHLPAVIAAAVGVSRSQARRLLQQGAVSLDGERVEVQDMPAAGLDGAVLQVGKRQFRRLRLA